MKRTLASLGSTKTMMRCATQQLPEYSANLKLSVKAFIFVVLSVFTLSAQANSLQLNGKALWCEDAGVGIVFEADLVCEFWANAGEMVRRCEEMNLRELPKITWFGGGLLNFYKSPPGTMGTLNLKTLELKWTPNTNKLGNFRKSLCSLSAEQEIRSFVKKIAGKETSSWGINRNDQVSVPKDAISHAQKEAKAILNDETKLTAFSQFIVGFHQGLLQSGYRRTCLSAESPLDITKKVLRKVLEKPSVQLQISSLSTEFQRNNLQQKKSPGILAYDMFFQKLWSTHAFDLLVKSCNAQRVE
jgi:hypothetical protein